MNAVFTNSSGDKQNFLYQYDKGQTLVVENLEYKVSPEVHFTTTALPEALVAQGTYKDGTLTVAIPNALLLSGRNITAYLYLEGVLSGETVKKIEITVRPRKKPTDYIYTDGMYITSVNGLQSAVFDYIKGQQEFIDDVIVDYTTVHLIDDVTGIEYMVGINNSKLYIKPMT